MVAAIVEAERDGRGQIVDLVAVVMQWAIPSGDY
jgi:crotonobetainyl-CoA:carnitine CoA-transferase CaiB-like acyl-CoA transferase